MAFIDINNLGKRFGSVPAVSEVNLAIGEREFITFLGPSGCGKTTTLRLLAGFLEPNTGTIHVAGRLLSSPQQTVAPEQRQMGMVFQNYAVWPHMTVFENVAFGLKAAKVERGEIQKRVAQTLAAVGLDGLENRSPSQLSGGQQQRVALARSLVVEPATLLLDEPLSNLDAKLREHMRGELKSLQRRTGITFIYVTHDQAEAMALSDRIAVFRKGRILQVGTPREVYERPANIFVADFMGLVNRLEGTLVERDAKEARVRIGSHVLTVALPARDAAGPVTVAVRPEAIRIGPPVEYENRLDGVVSEATFLGNLIDYRIDAGGLNLRVQADRRQFHAAGTAVTLAIPVAECVVMARGPEEAQ
jgi:iron(III) transport system ATP-binding protein